MSVKKGIFAFGGTLSFIVGAVGIIVPLLPTTPFLLLSSFCYLKGSSRLHTWLISHPAWGPRIERIRSGQGMTRKEKLTAYATAFVMISPIIIFSSSTHLRIFLLLILFVKAVVLLRMRTAV